MRGFVMLFFLRFRSLIHLAIVLSGVRMGSAMTVPLQDFPWEKYSDIDGVQRVEIVIDPFTITYRVAILSGLRLYREDIFESTDVFCALYWNGESIGRTSVRTKGLSPPQWRNDRFKIEVLAETDILKCSLLIVVIELCKRYGQTVLGCVDLKGGPLKEFLCSGKSVNREFDLTPYLPTRLKEAKEFSKSVSSVQSGEHAKESIGARKKSVAVAPSFNKKASTMKHKQSIVVTGSLLLKCVRQSMRAWVLF